MNKKEKLTPERKRVQKEFERKQAKMNKLERRLIPTNVPGESIYVAKKLYDRFTKKNRCGQLSR